MKTSGQTIQFQKWARKLAPLLWFASALVFVSLTIAAMNWTPAGSVANPPNIITYQGKLLDGGTAVTTTQSMQFRIYNEALGGQLVYTASGTVGTPAALSVTPSSGIFAVDLGDTSASPATNEIDPSIFATSSVLYLEVRIGATTLSPRKKLGSVAYALNSRYLMGLTTDTSSTSEYIPRSDSNGRFTFSGDPQGAFVDEGTVYINALTPDADETILGVANGGAEIFRVDREGDVWIAEDLNVDSSLLFVDASENKVGINSSTPTYPLSVTGQALISATSTILGDFLVGAFSETMTTSGFVLDGNDAFFADDVGVAGDFFVENEIHVGTSSLHLNGADGNGLISMTSGPLTIDSIDSALKLNTNNNQIVTFGTGNVGINSSTPGFQLSVGGNAYFTGTTTQPGLVVGPGGTGGSISLNGSVISSWNDVGISSGDSGNFATTTISGPLTVTSTESHFKGAVTNPVQVASLTGVDLGIGINNPYTIEVQGDYAYIATAEFAGTNEITIYDVSDPNNPALVGQHTSGDNSFSYYLPTEIVVDGNYLYMTAAGTPLVSSTLSIFDVSDKANPVGISQVNATTYGTLDQASGIDVVGPYAYVVGYEGDGLMTFDISDPTDPRMITEATHDGVTLKLDGAQEVVVNGKYAYVIAALSDTLNIFDISDPTNLTLVGTLEDGVGGAVFDAPQHLSYAAGHIYAVTSKVGDDDLIAVDVTDPSSPTTTDRMTGGGAGALIDQSFGIDVSGDYAYVPSAADDAITIVDISDPTDLTVVSTVTNGGGIILDSPQDVFVSGNRLYVTAAGATDALTILNVGGLKASNLEAGATKLGRLTVDGATRFRNVVEVENGLRIANNGLAVGGDISLYSNTTSFAVTNTIRFGNRARFTSNISPSGALVNDWVYIFDTENAFPMTTTSYLFSIRNAGTPVFSVAAGGNVHTTGTYFGEGINVATPGAPGDLAERVDIRPEQNVEPGDVLVVDSDATDRYAVSSGAHATAVAGVVSTNPTITIGSGKTENQAVMAMVGRVPIKVSNQNGAIHRGDVLVTAGEPGHAMKYDASVVTSSAPIAIIGVALESFIPEVGASSTGKIMGLVRSGWVRGAAQSIAEVEQDLAALAENVAAEMNLPNEELNVAEENGQLTMIETDLNLNGHSIINVASITGADGNWKIDEEGRFVTSIEYDHGERKSFYALQSEDTEIVLSGSAELDNGYARVTFSPEMRAIIDPDVDMKISVTLTSNAKGVFVQDKTSAGFTVKEVRNGDSDASFDWVVIAQRKLEGIALEEDIAQEEMDEEDPAHEDVQEDLPEEPVQEEEPVEEAAEENPEEELVQEDEENLIEEEPAEEQEAPAEEAEPVEEELPAEEPQEQEVNQEEPVEEPVDEVPAEELPFAEEPLEEAPELVEEVQEVIEELAQDVEVPQEPEEVVAPQEPMAPEEPEEPEPVEEAPVEDVVEEVAPEEV